jgi:hypothetical protein
LRFYSPDAGRGNVIRRNEFHGFFDGLGICPEESSAVTNETDFYENQTYDNGDDGVETDGRCANVRLWKNVIHDTLSGISLAPVIDGPIYCLRNRMYLLGAGHSEAGYSGLSFKFNSGDGSSGSIYLFHNTVDAQRASNNGLSIQSPSNWVILRPRNNIWAGTHYAIATTGPAAPTRHGFATISGAPQQRPVYGKAIQSTGVRSVHCLHGQGNPRSCRSRFRRLRTPGTHAVANRSLIDRGCRIPCHDSIPEQAGYRRH